VSQKNPDIERALVAFGGEQIPYQSFGLFTVRPRVSLQTDYADRAKPAPASSSAPARERRAAQPASSGQSPDSRMPESRMPESRIAESRVPESRMVMRERSARADTLMDIVPVHAPLPTPVPSAAQRPVTVPSADTAGAVIATALSAPLPVPGRGFAAPSGAVEQHPATIIEPIQAPEVVSAVFPLLSAALPGASQPLTMAQPEPGRASAFAVAPAVTPAMTSSPSIAPLAVQSANLAARVPQAMETDRRSLDAMFRVLAHRPEASSPSEAPPIDVPAPDPSSLFRRI